MSKREKEPRDMLLVIDIGNTHVVVGVFEEERLRHSWRILTRRDRTSDEYAALIRNLFEMEGIAPARISAMAISSVVPPLNEEMVMMGRRYFHLEPLLVRAEQQDLIPILYEPAADVGADRVVSAVAAIEMVGTPSIVVDFGTATTFDAISGKGEYLGGIISPGIGIAADALFQRAARLPRIEIRKPAAVIGKSTAASIQSGLYFGYVDLVEGILRRMKEDLGEAPVVATGGWAHLLAPEISSIDRVEEDLILYGLKIFFQRQAAR